MMAAENDPKTKGGTVQTIIIALGGAAFGALATITTGAFDYFHKSDELKVHLVEVALGILRADPKEDVVAARGWALDLIEKNSGVQFSKEDRAVLLKKPLAWKKDSFFPMNWDDFDKQIPTIKEQMLKPK